MTSEAKIRANRRNALQSTGPKTAHGKAQSRQNSRKHGLAVPLGIDDVEVQELTDVMAELERMFGEVREMIRSAAKDQCEVTRVQRARADMLNEQIGKMLHSEAEPVTAEEQIATAMAAIVPDLEALDRYERRAVSSLRKKIRKLQGQ
jgi:Lhr-like helicase